MKAILCLFAWAAIGACSQMTDVDRKPLPGTWVGFFSVIEGLDVYNAPGATNITVAPDLSAEVMVQVSGSTSNWGTFSLEVTGSPTISDTEAILGEVTLTRYRPGVDTLTVTATWAGQFDSVNQVMNGTWIIKPGQDFTGNGAWGGSQQ